MWPRYGIHDILFSKRVYELLDEHGALKFWIRRTFHVRMFMNDYESENRFDFENYYGGNGCGKYQNLSSDVHENLMAYEMFRISSWS